VNSKTESDRLIADVHRRIGEARKRAEQPPDGIQALVPLEMHLADEDWPHIWELVWRLRDVDPETFNRSTENAAATACVRSLANLESPPTIGRLANLLAIGRDEDSRHLVLTPVANLVAPGDYTELSQSASLIRAPLQNGEKVELIDRAKRQFGDWIRPPFRMHRLGDRGELDTRNGAALLSEERGSPAVAAERARIKARYAIAVWSILRPPGQEEIMADTGTWLPQPWIHRPQSIRALQTEPGSRRPSQGEWVAYNPYEPPGDAMELRLPFTALQKVKSSRCAQALLSASWSLAQTGRASRLTLSDRLIQLYAAVAALCDPGTGQVAGSEILARWNRMTERVGTWEAIAGTRYRGLDPKLANERLKGARDIATHGADAVLIDLGFPDGDPRRIAGGRVAEPSTLAVAGLSSDLSALLHAARHATRHLWLKADEQDWNDGAFSEHFA
jgi:hypothetical protein